MEDWELVTVERNIILKRVWEVVKIFVKLLKVTKLSLVLNKAFHYFLEIVSTLGHSKPQINKIFDFIVFYSLQILNNYTWTVSEKPYESLLWPEKSCLDSEQPSVWHVKQYQAYFIMHKF